MILSEVNGVSEVSVVTCRVVGFHGRGFGKLGIGAERDGMSWLRFNFSGCWSVDVMYSSLMPSVDLLFNCMGSTFAYSM